MTTKRNLCYRKLRSYAEERKMRISVHNGSKNSTYRTLWCDNDLFFMARSLLGALKSPILFVIGEFEYLRAYVCVDMLPCWHVAFLCISLSDLLLVNYKYLCKPYLRQQ